MRPVKLGGDVPETPEASNDAPKKKKAPAAEKSSNDSGKEASSKNGSKDNSRGDSRNDKSRRSGGGSNDSA